MKLAVVASLVLHVAGLLAIPTKGTFVDSERQAFEQKMAGEQAVAASGESCKCDAEVLADCPLAPGAR